MPAAAWMTIAVAGLIIAITAVGLLRVILHLRAIRTKLGLRSRAQVAAWAAGRAEG